MAPVCKLMGLPLPSGFLNPSSLNPQAFFLTDTALPESNPLRNVGSILARRERRKWRAFNGLCVLSLQSGLDWRSQVRNPEQGPETNRLLTRSHFFERFETASLLLTARQRSRGDRDPARPAPYMVHPYG